MLKTTRQISPTWLALSGFALTFSCLVAAQAAELEINKNTWLNPQAAALKFDLSGPFVHLDEGRILAYHQNTTQVSRNNGVTWSPPRPVFAAESQFQPATPTMIRTTEGTLVFAFVNTAEMVWKWNDERRDADAGTTLPTYVTRSHDGGQTWEAPQMLHSEWTGDLRNMIQTQAGTIVLSSMQLWNNPGRHVMLTYSSHDDGLTWTRSNFIDLGGNGHHDGAVEGTLVPLNDGRIWMLIRTNWDFFWEAFSTDEGQSWRVIRPSKIAASSSPGLLKRLASGRLVLFWNRLMPTGWEEYPRMGGIGSDNSPQWSLVPASASREELSVAFSDDDGQTWSKPLVLAARNDQVSYPQAFEVRPGTLWVTSGYGNLRVEFREQDFISSSATDTDPK